VATVFQQSAGGAAASIEADPQARTMCEAFQATARRAPDEIALRSADGAVELTWAQYAEQVERLAAGLAALGVRRGDTVALMLTNRVEFYPCDTAALHLGATPFSIYNTSSAEQIEYLFSNARNRVVITERAFLGRVLGAPDAGVEHIVCVDGPADGAITLERLSELGEADFEFETAWRAVEPDDVLTLIYTSGTTGPPKGVQLTHANMLAQCRAAGQVLPIPAGARITSYLPSAHAADRWSSHYNQIMYGLQITAVPDARQIAAVLPAVRPTVWGGVPRIFEKIAASIEAAIANEPDEQRREVLRKAIDVSLQKVRLEDTGEPVPPELAEAHSQLDAAVLSKLRERMGLEQAEWIISGAAPLPRRVHEFLVALGLPMVELYGMSECSCIATVCHPSEARIGTVGKILPGSECRLAEDGELLIRGPIVMQGYRDDPERTADAFDADGWLRTGDIAQLDDDGYVKIVDRKKELIINAAGKNMSPANIEEKLKSSSPLIGQAVCIGDARPYNVALLVLDPETSAGVDADAIDAQLQVAVAHANEQLSRVEQIKRYELLSDEWLPGGDELTPTMKLKRKPIAQKYGATIERLYGPS
jgi:long-subunit acyl-CoA synthetase (AMP-forming)